MTSHPSLTALRAFDMVARLGSFTKAGRALNVTRPAISKQIKTLEAALQCQLIVHTRPKVILTERGKELAAGLQHGFDIITASVQKSVEQARRPNTVKLLVEQDFASSWLAARIGDFLVDHPGISVEVNAERNGRMHFESDFSFRIFYGRKGSDKTASLVETYLCDWIDIPLCTPEYATAHAIENGRYDDAHFLIDQNYNPWVAWFDRTGFKNPEDEVTYSRFNETSLCLSAALAGSGITMGDSVMCLDAIDSNRLVAPFKIGLQSTQQYSVYFSSDRKLSQSETIFYGWLTQTIEAYQQKVSQVFARIGIKVLSSDQIA